MKVLYVTYCAKHKNDFLKGMNVKVKPDQLYISSRIVEFVNYCKQRKVDWAIFSDLYGLWFPNKKHEWYEMPPDFVTADDLILLLKDFLKRTKRYDIIYFYHPAKWPLHPVYQKVIEASDKVKLISILE